MIYSREELELLVVISLFMALSISVGRTTTYIARGHRLGQQSEPLFFILLHSLESGPAIVNNQVFFITSVTNNITQGDVVRVLNTRRLFTISKSRVLKFVARVFAFNQT